VYCSQVVTLSPFSEPIHGERKGNKTKQNKTKRAMPELIGKKWNKQYEKLVEFKRKNGHCVVPSTYQEDMALGIWVSTQRKTHANNTIRPDRKNLLDELGFVWKADKSAAWNKQYEKLVEFKRKNGTCIVPRTYQEDLSLKWWVSKQRKTHADNIMRRDRMGLLHELGFAWGGGNQDKIWHKQYEQLVEFKQKHGHCLVPTGYQDDTPLALWVNTQRQLHNRNAMGLDRKGRLDEIGFIWRVQRPSTCPTESKQMAARTNPRDGGSGSGSSVKKDDGGRDEEDSEPLEETEPGRGHVRNRFACPSPNVKRPRTRLARSKQMAARTKPIGGASGSGSSVEKDDGGRDEEDSTPFLVNTSGDLDFDFHSETTSTSIVGLPNKTLEEAEPAGQSHVINRVACPSPNVKRPRSCLAESEQMAAMTNPRDGAIVSPSSVENDGVRDEDDSTPFLVTTSSALVASYPDQEVVQEEAHNTIPSCWNVSWKVGS
jgi:hypothetical protein